MVESLAQHPRLYDHIKLVGFKQGENARVRLFTLTGMNIFRKKPAFPEYLSDLNAMVYVEG